MTRYLSFTILFCQIPQRWGRPHNPPANLPHPPLLNRGFTIFFYRFWRFKKCFMVFFALFAKIWPKNMFRSSKWLFFCLTFFTWWPEMALTCIMATKHRNDTYKCQWYYPCQSGCPFFTRFWKNELCTSASVPYLVGCIWADFQSFPR